MTRHSSLTGALLLIAGPLFAATEPVPTPLLDRNPNDGNTTRQLCYVFGTNVQAPFRFVITTSLPNQVRLDPAHLTDRNVVSVDPINGDFTEPRVGSSGNTVVIDYTGPDPIPAGTEVCFTISEEFFVGFPIPANVDLDMRPARLSDGFDLDVAGNLVIEPFPDRFNAVAKDGPLAVRANGGANQEAGKLQIVNPDGDPAAVVNNLVVQALNNKLQVVQDPGEPNVVNVQVVGNPVDASVQNDAIANDGIKDTVTFDFFDEFGNPRSMEIDVTVSTNGDLPELDSDGTPRGSSVDTNSISLDEIVNQLAGGDPISMSTGAFYFTESLLDLGGPLPLRFALAYGSDSFPHEDGVALPEKFEHNHRALISAGAGADADAVITLGMGRELIFQRTGFGPWLLTGGHQITHTLAETGGHYLLIDPSTNVVRVFKKTAIQNNNIRAHLVAIRDRVGNSLRYTYDGGSDPRVDGPASVTDGLGRELRFTYAELGAQTKKFLTRVEDHTGRAWTFQYEISPTDNAGGSEVTLRSVTDPLGGVMTYTYAGDDRLAGVQKPRGNTPYSQTYGTGDEANAVTTQTDALGRTSTFAKENGVPGFGLTQRTLTNPDGTVERYFHNADGTLMSAMTDAAGNTMRFEQDGQFKRVKKTVDRDGAVTEIGYNPFFGTVSSITNARGEQTRFFHVPPPAFPIQNPDNGELVFIGNTFGDLNQIAFPDTTFRTYQRDIVSGNVTRVTDRAGDRDDFTRDFLGNVVTQTNGEGGVSTFTYDGAGNLASRTDDDTGTTTFACDALNRLVTLTRPDAATVTFTYDALDRVLTRTDERGTVTKFDYDANSNLTAVTRDFGGALEQVTAFEYDALDRLVKVVDPASNETLLSYPYHDKPESLTLPDGSVVQFDYDARRALVGSVDETGVRMDFENDPAERVRVITSPERRNLTLERDALGAVVAMIDPTGDRASAELDVNSRAVSTTDPLGRKHGIQRDGEGRVTGRNEPVSGETDYLYDDNGRLTKLTDVRGKEWNLTYTVMGRLDTVTDPNAKTWDYDYDTRGRLSQITHPDGVIETRSYDGESHLTGRSFSDGLNLGFTYDALDRLKTTASTPVIIDYDSRGNLTTTTIHGQTFNGAHDSRSRLTSVDYAGQMTVTYTYDPRGLVTRVTDSLTGAQVDFTYDADRLLTQITRSNGVNTLHTYDADGKISRISHAALGTIDFAYNAANEPTAITDTGFPVDGGTFLAGPSVETQAFDDANQITAHTYDDRGRPISDGIRTYTWDSADRLIGVVNGGDTLAYDYTATGQITSRTLNGQTTEYGYAYSVASQPILAERKNAAFTRFYVALPDGRLLYQIDLTPTPAVRFYHFGKVGETRFLTDAAGAVSDAYAYDAFGRLLGKTGASDQIYAFTGQLGVRHDPEAGLVHMRARHYDPVSGRFLSRDPIHLALMGRNCQHANPYHFVEGRVTSVVDPSGLDAFFDDLWQFSGERWEDDVIRAHQLRREEQAREAKQNELVAMMFVGPGAGVDNQTFLNYFRQMAAFSLKASEREEVFAMLDQFASNPGEGTEAADYLSALFARLQAASAENKAAAKALIGRGLEEVIRFVPISVREVRPDNTFRGFISDSEADALRGANGIVDPIFSDGFESGNTSAWTVD